ncbi:neuronal acetylcholine receptor subunit alpha-10-like [Ostrea edulis]|uniref:neuronal acetylcholine receptor subunit alpha-10-like n=1 Tax=Ostrea edulis TaxID=37623 RepID=UPI0024AFC411|nr:neuronal acetylcholine receptor subunit alpha-10-like [Ostrea edulis]XP_056008969.1 neuronal acetylcholine receptor subunit alpha-10-like [Ostrea edulis]
MNLSVVALFLIFAQLGYAVNRTDIENLYTDLILTVASSQLLKDVPPAQYTVVSGSLTLLSISGLDEVSGTFSTMVNLALYWQDERLKWDSSSYDNLSSIVIPQDQVWTPSIIMRNSAKKVKKLGLENNVVTISSDGWVSLNIADYLETVCNFDVTHFPFDRQKCEILFFPWIYTSGSVDFKQSYSNVDLTLYSENGMWKILSTTSTVNYILRPSQSGQTYRFAELKYTIDMERRSSYFVLTIFMPVIMLLLLNSVVFLLPTDSGERVGYSITCLLALAVFLTLTADNLPRTSDPLSVLACFLMLLVMTSAGICLMTILSVWLHHKDEKSPMPIYLKKFVYHVLCRGRKTQKADDKRVIVTVETPKSTSKVKRDFKGTQSHGTKKVQMNGIRPTSLRQIKVHSVDEKQPKENKNTDDPYSDITWKMFAELFNLLCLVVTLSFTGILFFLYVLIARGNL